MTITNIIENTKRGSEGYPYYGATQARNDEYLYIAEVEFEINEDLKVEAILKSNEGDEWTIEELLEENWMEGMSKKITKEDIAEVINDYFIK